MLCSIVSGSAVKPRVTNVMLSSAHTLLAAGCVSGAIIIKRRRVPWELKEVL